MSYRALGGGELVGSNLVRYVYLDEAGISNREQEPQMVMAGIIVNGDRQWKPVDKYLQKMVSDNIPVDQQPNFVFHAKDLFHGTGVFGRESFDRPRRWAILRELCEIPRKFGLPIISGSIIRSDFMAANPRVKPSESVALQMAAVSLYCALAAEKYMRLNAPDEVATLVYENNKTAQNMIRQLHTLVRSIDSSDAGAIVDDEYLHCLPFEKIVGGALFAEKIDSSLLQIADAVAFTLKRKKMKTPECDYFFEVMDEQVLTRFKEWGPRPIRQATSFYSI